MGDSRGSIRELVNDLFRDFWVGFIVGLFYRYLVGISKDIGLFGDIIFLGGDVILVLGLFCGDFSLGMGFGGGFWWLRDWG